ncbi:MAG: SIMPL domain-containing protein [Candidatus Firestonebacteria bacterium]
MKTITLLLLLIALRVCAQEPAKGADLSGISEKYTVNKDGKLDDAVITGIGILTSTPDEVYVQLSLKSDPSNTLKAAQIDLERKIDFITARLAGAFRLKKENFKSAALDSKLKEQSIRNPASLVYKDSSGKIIQKKEYKYELSKNLIISGLAGKKMGEVLEIIDKAVGYGATAVAEAVKEDPAEVESTTVLGTSTSKMALSKGVSKLAIKKGEDAEKNELINYYFSEATLEKLSTKCREKAAADAKEKLAKLSKIYPFNSNEKDIQFSEDISAVQTSEGELTVKCEYSVAITKKKAESK